MSAIRYAKQIVKEIQAYEKIKKHLLKLHSLLKHYEGLKAITREHKKNAAISAHIAKLHSKAAKYKSAMEKAKSEIETNIHKMRAEMHKTI